jgi:hypothetical protein
MDKKAYKNIIKKYSDLSLRPDDNTFISNSFPAEDNRASHNREVQNLKIQSLQWKYEIDARSWGIKDISITVPPQVVKISGVEEVWSDNDYEEKPFEDSIDLSKLEVEVEATKTLGKHSIFPNMAEIYDDKIILHF